ncbi:cytochrome c/c1 heme-lyase [Diplogelasinospora grovesii]|uniref:Holocytochrome c-type synthase n=1 Tax=Diplogelasinospora grovesii TaxID=303347 RepID=A0AAN6RZA1_9PEZI|nr:cytochrome c/c1 heme-lyase [Diplogelasinospora grovesii]
MHLDLLDTVLVSRKDSSTSSGSKPVAANTKMTNSGVTDTEGVTTVAGEGEVKCPVDHKTRETWLRQARAAPVGGVEERAQQGAGDATLSRGPSSEQTPLTSASAHTSSSWSSSSWSPWHIPLFSRQQQATSQPPAANPAQSGSPPTATHPQLDTSREVSSIPRSSAPGPSACPVNHEQETGTSATGNWVYPSEKMFFEAMKRKGHGAAAADMKTVVPIHNAVNERAWAEILQWEQPYVAPHSACGGPRLHSFAGLSESMSPKARINTLLGYTAPFDRHDWVVDRCGTKVEYVIDFYAGRQDGTGAGKVNFYLDVRPKLNTWEGVKMRALRATGLA